MELALLFLGIIIIIIGAEIFVDAIESTAINFKIPKMFIALTVVAFGTSFPELIISFNAMISKNSDIVFSNVIGSTIFNTLLIIGVSSLVNPIKIKEKTIKQELPFHIMAILFFVFLYLDSLWDNSVINSITRLDALFLLALFGIFIFYLTSLIKNKTKEELQEKEKAKFSLKKSIIFSILGLGLIILGSNFTVNNVVLVAENFGWSSKTVTMIFIVIGTSMPELILSIIAAKKGQYDFILGNIIGTNIFNLCIVLGLPILLFGGVASLAFNYIDMLVMIFGTLIIFIFARNDKVISVFEGIFMILVFLVYYVYILI